MTVVSACPFWGRTRANWLLNGMHYVSGAQSYGFMLTTPRRTAAPGTHLSAKADYRMLAAATRRSGDTTRTAIADFNLGVSHDNAENFQSAVEVRMR